MVPSGSEAIGELPYLLTLPAYGFYWFSLSVANTGEIVPQPEEIEDARWFHIDNLPALPARQSIARYLIELYLARRLGRPEPVLPG